MSIQRHPNINAVGFTTDIYMAYLNRLRGAAGKRMTEQTMEILSNRLGKFVTEISFALDEQFGIEIQADAVELEDADDKGRMGQTA